MNSILAKGITCSLAKVTLLIIGKGTKNVGAAVLGDKILNRTAFEEKIV